MRYPHLFFAAATLFASSISVQAETDEKGFVRTRPEQLDWKVPFPGATPLALLEGDPSKPGIFLVCACSFRLICSTDRTGMVKTG